MRSPMGDGARRVRPPSPVVVDRLCFDGVERVGYLVDGLVAVLGGGLGGEVGEVSICSLANEEPPRDNLRRKPAPLSF